MGSAACGGSQKDVDGEALVAFEHIPHELVFTRRPTRHEEHQGDPIDDFDLGHLGIVRRRPVTGGRNDPQHQFMAARCFEPRHLESDSRQFTVGRQHHLGGIDHASPLRRHGVVASVGRGPVGQLDFHRLPGEPLGLEVALNGEAIPRIHPRWGEQIGDTDIRWQSVRSGPHAEHRHP